MLVQSTKVEAIKWTLSGDGIITGGVEVVLWRRKEKSWERAWKFKPQVPHFLVSASWSIEGFQATAPYSKLQVGDLSSQLNEASKCVLVTYGGNVRFIQAELRHPSAISMIQWRPSTGRTSNKGTSNPLRSVLLTGCLDGTVRLWSENDSGRARKSSKDPCENKIASLLFQVVAVIEVNEALCGTLGSDVFVRWAFETDSIINICGHCFSSNDHERDKAGSCEWLIGFGPQLTVTLWAIHCLDNFCPVRFPRITLWKKQELMIPEVGKEGLILDNVFIARNRVFSPPEICSFVELLPCNTLAWLNLYSVTSPETEHIYTNKSQSQNSLSSHALGILDISSHSGKLVQIVVHPYLFEVELAASLDTDGMLLFWHLSPASNSIPSLPMLNPSRKLSEKTFLPGSHPTYTSLGWAPAILHDNRVLVMGHAGGIDCFMVKVMKNENEKISCQHLCTVPFGGEEFGQGPTNLCSIPLPSSCNRSFISDNFMLLAIWKKNFRVLSWKITIHQSDLPSDCSCAIRDTAGNKFWVFDSDFCGKQYQIYVDCFSSIFPAMDNEDEISSFSVICPTNFVLPEQEQTSASFFCSSYLSYHLITGHHGGIVKLWRSVPENLSSSEWKLVGMLGTHQGPIMAISPSACGRRVATASCLDSSSTSGANTVCIWECVRIGSSGNFILEDTIYVGAEIISLNWLMVGDGQSLLGVCLHNELKIYTRWRCGGQSVLKSREGFEGNLWVCIAVTHTYPIICDFFWGPRASVGIIHLDYFSLYSHLSLFTNKNSPAKFSSETCESPLICDGRTGGNPFPAIFTDYDACDSKRSSTEDNGRECELQLAMTMGGGDNLLSMVDVELCREMYNSGSNYGLQRLLEVAGQLGGAIPSFHPEALLYNISAGNWKRAYVALRNLVQHLACSKRSQKSHCFKRHSVFPQVPLSNYFDGIFSKNLGDGTFQWSGEVNAISSSSQIQNGASQFAPVWGGHTAPSTAFSSSSTISETKDFLEAVGKLNDYGSITNDEKLQIHALIDILKEVSDQHSASAYGSLDEPGRRFWVAVNYRRRYFAFRFGTLPLVGELVVPSGLIGWAFHSDCQENLFNSLLPNEATWEEMRDVGVGFWYTNTTQLRMKMEKLARQQYLKNRDPKACALLYIALNRLQVLAGLFKMSKDEKDKPLVVFLSRNFQEDKNKAAALKNAYVLMGKHQLELAIAFFLLGGDTSSAVTVCAKNLGDEQLALVICRLVEGYGGPSEQNLISKFSLPSAISRGDYWLAAVFEWTLGSYHKAFIRILGAQRNLVIQDSAKSNCQVSLLDPSIGQYCLMLATKTSLKNAIGEQQASFFGQWAMWMSTIALNRCGLPLEALECLSSSVNIFGTSSQGRILDNGDIGLQNEVSKLFPGVNTSNWTSGDIASCIDYHAKLDLAMQYFPSFLKEHPNWGHIGMEFFGESTNLESENQEYKMLIEDFDQKLAAALLYLEKKFSLIPLHIINKIVLFFCGNGMKFIGYHTVCAYVSKFLQLENSNGYSGLILHPILPRLILEAYEEVSPVFSRYIAICSISCSKVTSCSSISSMPRRTQIQWLVPWDMYLQSLMRSFWNLSAMLKLYFVTSADHFLNMLFTFLDLAEYYACFASSYIQMNIKDLAMIVLPLLMRCSQGDAPFEIIKDLKKLLFDTRKMLGNDLFCENLVNFCRDDIFLQPDLLTSIPADDRWQVFGWSLWCQVSSCLQHLLCSLPEELEQSSSLASPGKLPKASTLFECETDFKDEILLCVLQSLPKLLKATCTDVSVHCGRQFTSYLVQKVDTKTRNIIFSMEDGQSVSTPLHKHLGQTFERVKNLKKEKELSPLEILWLICADPSVIRGLLLTENLKCFEHIKKHSFGGWDDIYISILRACEVGESPKEEDRIDSPRNSSPRACLSPNDHPFLSSWGGDTKKAPFTTSKEIYRRNGELLEALCVNSVDQHQAALATNRKGILFFNWEDGLPNDNGYEYLWAESDWPPNGWAGSESTPVPTCVSPGVGLGSRKGAHLGLGGATVGADVLSRPGKDVINGGAIRVSGYAGLGIPSLGWGIQEDFEQFVDPPPTVDSVRTSSFSAHPSRPLFLVGSSNTHIYLWEFGKDRATATYGVLPAANVPPPYALASISAVRFDHYGHRFVTAALDGTVCTWQLEVGGRSNVRPTESSICFDNHTSDATFITASGSIIAAAGYSSTGVNVVMWDTLAPPATSQASIMCHEGGASSLSVFDNNIGSGSISPLIVTGGKGGDVGLHDFRYIATGRTKKHKQSGASEPNSNTPCAMDMWNKSGDQNRNGMLWYIPKAHSGSVTKISTIPNTSFFLTGSKDGDVKLWDAKTARLVYHWPKLHERHTFLQPGSRGLGGVFRAAVTDIRVVSRGFLTCGGDGTVKLVMLRDFDQM